MENKLSSFYARVDQWKYWQNSYETTGNVDFLRKQCNPDGKSNVPLLNHIEFMIFNATLRRGVELNDDEKAWLASEDRCALQVDVVYA